MTRNLTLVGLMLGAMIGSFSGFEATPQNAPSKQAVRIVQQSAVPPVCQGQHRGPVDVMRCEP